MNLAIDIGNTYSKFGFFEDRILIKNQIVEGNDFKKHIALIDEYKDKSKLSVIVCSVIAIDSSSLDYLSQNFQFLIFDSSTPIQINNLYHSPLSLGMDRLAAVIGAQQIYTANNILVIDAGTCITYDFINSNRDYIGGAISPGIQMRFKALNNYTDKLPLVVPDENYMLVGRDTMGAIKSGVLNGVIGEIKSFIENYRWQYPDLKVIITGGDSSFLAIHLKNSIFAAPHLVLQGLNEVLIYNKK